MAGMSGRQTEGGPAEVDACLNCVYPRSLGGVYGYVGSWETELLMLVSRYERRVRGVENRAMDEHEVMAEQQGNQRGLTYETRAALETCCHLSLHMKREGVLRALIAADDERPLLLRRGRIRGHLSFGPYSGIASEISW